MIMRQAAPIPTVEIAPRCSIVDAAVILTCGMLVSRIAYTDLSF